MFAFSIYLCLPIQAFDVKNMFSRSNPNFSPRKLHNPDPWYMPKKSTSTISSALPWILELWKVTYLSAWTLCVAADWLQGPYVYALYEARFFQAKLSSVVPVQLTKTPGTCVFFMVEFWNLPPKLPCQLHENRPSLSLFTAKTYLSPAVGFACGTSPYVKAYGFRPHEIAQLFVAGFGSAMISSCCLEKLEWFGCRMFGYGYFQK